MVEEEDVEEVNVTAILVVNFSVLFIYLSVFQFILYNN